MMRTRIKGNGTKSTANADSEPDFYSMPSVKPLSETPRKPPTKTTWKVTYEQTIKPKQDVKVKRPPARQPRRISSDAADFAPPPKVQKSMAVAVEPPMVQSSDDRILPFPRPSSFPAILPLVMPVLPKSTGLEQPGPVITPPHTPNLEDDEDMLPPAPDIPAWMLSDSAPLNEPLLFEGKTFHYLDACSFDCLHEDRHSVEAGGFSMKEADEFLAGI